MIRLVVVEDDPGMLAALGRLFAAVDGIRLTGAYETAEAALEATDWQVVDVLLSDLDLPGLSGPQLIAVARGQAPALLALAHTVHEQRDSLFEALRAGASGYLVKGLPAPELVASIRAIFGGETPVSPIVAGHWKCCGVSPVGILMTKSPIKWASAATRCTAISGRFTASCTSTAASRPCAKP